MSCYPGAWKILLQPTACVSRLLATFALLALFVLFILPCPVGTQPAAGALQIYLLNIGQGDAILIICPDGQHRMLIDSGAKNYPHSQDAFRQQLQRLLPGNKPTLDVVVATHPHEDHIGGMEWVLENFHVVKFVDNGRDYTSTFKGIRTLAQKQSKLTGANKLTYIQAGKFPSDLIADFCPRADVESRLLIPKGFGKASNVNNNSVVVLVTYKQTAFVFTGDAERQEEKQLLDDPLVKARLNSITFYKVGHHGAETSSTAPFLTQIAPQWAGVSSGCGPVSKNSGYRHPREATLRALVAKIPPGGPAKSRTVGAGSAKKKQWTTVEVHQRIWLTAEDDTLLFTSDGSTVTEQAAHVISAPLVASKHPCSP